MYENLILYDVLILIISAGFSAIMIMGAFVFPDTIFGITDASTCTTLKTEPLESLDP